MAKDPAFLFYYQDFMVGCDDLTNEETGAYIRCLCIQAAKGGITEKHMKNICKSHEVHSAIKSKFFFDEKIQLFKNGRLELEVSKRQKYSESRANNRKGKVKGKHMKNISKTYVPHMENENENTNEIKDKEGIREKKEIFSILNYEIDEILVESKAMLKQVSKEKILTAWKEFQSINSEEKFDGPTHAKRMFSIWIDKKKLKESKDETHNHGQRQSKPRNFN